jgi:hypothetical protein
MTMPTYLAIKTKILPSTQVLPTRVRVTVAGKRAACYSKWSFGDYGNDTLHVQAAERFREEARQTMGAAWAEGQWVAGELVPGVHVHVRVV